MAKFKKADNCINCPYQSKHFDFLSIEEKQQIQDNCLIVNFKKGENICKQDLTVTHSLYLSKGLVKVFIETEKKNTILRIASSGEYIGLQSIFGEGSYRFSITALEPSRICLIDIKYFKELCTSNPHFLMSITESISKCTNNIFSRLTFLNQKSVRARLATALVFFADEIYRSDTFVFSMSRQDLADYIGISRENAVRILGDFKKEKLISVSGKNITISNKQLLQAVQKIG
ncbi:MAG: Crp/Fnr family transcriptional regulator [Bacteroidales bacterium]|nr:Crp/Fnr family transcriptional regulator [Bacteroidales bacterium]